MTTAATGSTGEGDGSNGGVAPDANSGNTKKTGSEFVPKADLDKLTVLVDRLNQENEANKTKLSALGDISPEQLQEIIKQAKDGKIAAKGVDPKVIEDLVEERLKEDRTAWASDKEKLEGGLTESQKRIRELTVENKAMIKILPLLREDVVDVAKNLVLQEASIDEKTGELVFLDKHGKPRFSKEKPDKFLSVDEYIDELRTQRPSFFSATGAASGTKSQGTASSGQSGSGAQAKALDGVDATRYAKDSAYRETFDRSRRVEIAKALGW